MARQPGGGPEVLVLAGPNGAGKTTASRQLVPPGVTFLNPDVIATRLRAEGHASEGLDVAAGRVVLAEMRDLLGRRQSFCVETNLAGRGYVGSIHRWADAGYRVRLLFLALRSPELALARVAARVAAGGHDIAEDVVRRRWAAGLRCLLDTYIDLVDDWTVMDNSNDVAVIVADGRRGSATAVHNRDAWDTLRRLAEEGEPPRAR